MAPVARLVENVGVGAYLGAAHLLDDPVLLTAAASILTVEARHQTILNVLNGGTAIPQAFDIPLDPQEVLAIAGGFISGCDTGIVGLPPLTVTTTGSIQAGTSLTFSFDALSSINDTSVRTCFYMGFLKMCTKFCFADLVVPDARRRHARVALAPFQPVRRSHRLDWPRCHLCHQQHPAVGQQPA